jgi:hypothetical protein
LILAGHVFHDLYRLAVIDRTVVFKLSHSFLSLLLLILEFLLDFLRLFDVLGQFTNFLLVLDYQSFSLGQNPVDFDVHISYFIHVLFIVVTDSFLHCILLFNQLLFDLLDILVGLLGQFFVQLEVDSLEPLGLSFQIDDPFFGAVIEFLL